MLDLSENHKPSYFRYEFHTDWLSVFILLTKLRHSDLLYIDTKTRSRKANN